jgi:hypothetical protein
MPKHLFDEFFKGDPENKMGRYILDRNGEPVPCPSLIQWGQWLNTANRHVAKTDLPDGHWVSTVFLGLDHNHARTVGIPGADPRPILWETMVFSDYGEVQGFTRRYCSAKDAAEGHLQTVERVQAWLAAGMPATC